MAASANRLTKRSDNAMNHLGIKAAVHIYQGTLVEVDYQTPYLAMPAANTDAASHFLGVSYEEYDNTGGAASALTVKTYIRGEFEFAASGADNTWIGKTAYCTDDQTVNVTSGNYAVGRVVAIISATAVRVRIDGYC